MPNYYHPKFILLAAYALICISTSPITALAQPRNQNASWHFGGDEDGCVAGSCLCIPISTQVLQPYCLDYNNIDKPCQAATTDEVAHKKCSVPNAYYLPSQMHCLSQYFDDTHIATNFSYTCSMLCNPSGGQCRKI